MPKMTSHEYLNIGYIRSSCLSKISVLIDHLPKTQFCISRTYTEKKVETSKYRWLHCQMTGTREFVINWDIWKDKTPFPIVLQQLTEYARKYNFEDFTVNRVEVEIKDEELVEIINKHLAEEKLGGLDIDTRIYASFTNKPLAYDVIDSWDAKIVRDVNLDAIRTLKFKRSILDLVGIRTDRKTMASLVSMTNEKDVVKKILSHLNTTPWFHLPEIMKNIDPRTGKSPYPSSVRTYERINAQKWRFVGEEEVMNGNKP